MKFELSYTDIPSFFYELHVAIKMKFCLFTEEQRLTINEEYDCLSQAAKDEKALIAIYENNYNKYKVYDNSRAKMDLFYLQEESEQKLEAIEEALQDIYALKEAMDPENLPDTTWYQKVFEIFLEFSYRFRIKPKWFFQQEKEEVLEEIENIVYGLNELCDDALKICRFEEARKKPLTFEELLDIDTSDWYKAFCNLEDRCEKVKQSVEEMGINPSELKLLDEWLGIVFNYDNWLTNILYDYSCLRADLIEKLRIQLKQ